MPQLVSVERADRLVGRVLPAGKVNGDQRILHRLLSGKHRAEQRRARVGLDMYRGFDQLIGGRFDIKGLEQVQKKNPLLEE